MNNVLKLALVYTGVYFVFLVIYWIVFVTLAIFWKPLSIFFCVVFAALGIEYFVKRRRLLVTAS